MATLIYGHWAMGIFQYGSSVSYTWHDCLVFRQVVSSSQVVGLFSDSSRDKSRKLSLSILFQEMVFCPISVTYLLYRELVGCYYCGIREIESCHVTVLHVALQMSVTASLSGSCC